METYLEIRATGKFGNKGERYEILLGEEVIASGSSPECAACRVLKGRGITGKAWFRRAGRVFADFSMGIAWGASHYVSETTKTGVKFAKWEPNGFFKLTGGEHEPAGAE